MSRFGYRSMVHAVAVTFFPKTTDIQRRESMQTRRGFLKTVTAGTAGALLPGRGRAGLAAQSRRRVTIGGRPVKVIDAHAHCVIPVTDIVQGSPLAKMGGGASANLLGPQRLQVMDEQGVDVQALTINGFWWYAAADRGLADRIVRAQNEGLANWVAQHPDRFVALASVALQYPEHAAAQLEDGVKRLGLRGASIGGHVNGEDSRCRSDPFWAKAAELGVLVVMHPGGAENIIKDGALRGRGDLGSIIGNPLETTYFLSRLIFDGVFDKFPGLRLCAVHAGGYLPSYLGRSEAACVVRSNANCANKKKPSEYLKSQIVVDTMVFSPEGLRHLVAEMGVGQIVYGTDVPFNWPVTVDLVLEAPFLSDADKETILSGNLRRLLRIAA